MRLALLTAPLAICAAAAAATPQPIGDMRVFNPDASQPASCPPTSRYEAARRGGKLPPSLLGELPGADLYKAVYRHIGHCEAPIIVRYNIGAPSESNGKR
jgi:hypothetical protein